MDMKVDRDYIYKKLESVTDPEIPVLSVVDLGVVRDVQLENNKAKIIITPTYSGCPAMKVIEDDIKTALENDGLDEVTVETVLSPAWTTDWLSEKGKRKLEAYGIAPPEEHTEDKSILFGTQKSVKCPQCGSRDTKMLSQFGSTACKALYQCNSCKEPFDYFKCL